MSMSRVLSTSGFASASVNGFASASVHGFAPLLSTALLPLLSTTLPPLLSTALPPLFVVGFASAVLPLVGPSGPPSRRQDAAIAWAATDA